MTNNFWEPIAGSFCVVVGKMAISMIFLFHCRGICCSVVPWRLPLTPPTSSQKYIVPRSCEMFLTRTTTVFLRVKIVFLVLFPSFNGWESSKKLLLILKRHPKEIHYKIHRSWNCLDKIRGYDGFVTDLNMQISSIS